MKTPKAFSLEKIPSSDNTHHAPVAFTPPVPAFHRLNFLQIDLPGIPVPEAESQGWRFFIGAVHPEKAGMNAESAMFYGFIFSGKAWNSAVMHLKDPVIVIWHEYSYQYSQ